MSTRRLLPHLLVGLLCLPLSGCATLAQLAQPGSSVVLTLQDTALIVGELALAIDRAETEAFAATLYDAPRHQQLGAAVLQVLQAARAFERAVANGLPSGAAKLDLQRVLEALQNAAADIPILARAAGALGTVIGVR